MALDAAILARIREHVGSHPDDPTVEAIYGLAGNGTVETAALSILRARRADLAYNPASFEVVGDYKQDATKNLDLLDKRIADLESACGLGESVLSTGVLARCTGR